MSKNFILFCHVFNHKKRTKKIYPNFLNTSLPLMKKKFLLFIRGACIRKIQKFSENHFEMYQEPEKLHKKYEKHLPVFRRKFPKLFSKDLQLKKFSNFVLKEVTVTSFRNFPHKTAKNGGRASFSCFKYIFFM